MKSYRKHRNVLQILLPEPHKNSTILKSTPSNPIQPDFPPSFSPNPRWFIFSVLLYSLYSPKETSWSNRKNSENSVKLANIKFNAFTTVLLQFATVLPSKGAFFMLLMLLNFQEHAKNKQNKSNKENAWWVTSVFFSFPQHF